MLLKVKLLMLFLPTLYFVNSAVANPNLETPDLRKISIEDLQKQKLYLEIKRIDDDLSSSDFSSLLQAGTLTSAFIALIISIVTANRANKLQIESQKDQQTHHEKDRVSELLKELGSESIAVKVAAMQALMEYKVAYTFIVNLLRVETNQLCIDVAIKILGSDPKLSLDLLLDETRKIHTTELNIAAKLVSLGIDRKTTAKNFNLDNAELLDWIERKYGSRYSALSEIAIINHMANSGLTRHEVVKNEINKLYQQWGDLAYAKHNIISGIEEVVRESIKTGYVLKLDGAYLRGIVLSNLDLSEWSFKNCHLDHANFENSTCVKTNFSSTKAIKLSLKRCQLDESSFNNAKLKCCDLRLTKGKRISFVEAELFEPNFDGCNNKYAVFSKAKIAKMSFKNTLFIKADFCGSKIHLCDISACDLSGSNFTKAILGKCTFNTARLRKSTFHMTKIFKTEITKSSFDDGIMTWCTLDKVASIDSQFKNVDFSDSIFTQVDFDPETVLDGIRSNNTKCKDCSPNLTSS